MVEKTLDKQLLIRILIMAFIVMLMLSALIIRLWDVQIRSGSEFDEKTSRQYARSIRLPALRGRIFSSDGEVLATNRPTVDVLFHLSEMPISGNQTKSVKMIMKEVLRAEKAVGRASGITEQQILAHMQHYPAIPMTVFKELTPAELAKLSELMPEIPGLEFSAGSQRWYPFRSLASQIIGYTGPQDPRTAEDRGNYFYYLPETIGKEGLERVYNQQLQGIPGMKLVKVNHRGFVYETIGTPTPARPSMDLVLTLNARMQAKAEKLLRGRSGAAVVMDVSDGSVLAMASAPGFDLNSFIPRISQSEYDKLKDDPGRPFLNKAVSSAYMPGSIVKPLVALALLENGVQPEEETVCDGATHFGEHSYIRCWAWLAGGHGSVSLTDAIKVSCNDFFCENGMELGLEKLREMYESAGIGSRTGIGLPSESAGVLPDRKRFPKWNSFETALISIGQGKIQVSPLQAVSYAAAIANGGILWKPRLVREFKNSDTGESTVEPPVRRGQLKATSEHIAIVREGMFRAVNEAGGGARRAYCEELAISGKTGTAEVGPRNKRTKNTWFIGFAELPSGRKLAVCVLVLNGESGNKSAAPVALELFRYALHLNL
ncbi:MAG: penicillin-binding protein 2 [Lentisphaeria bacterium]|nr:penicillin-binding protein 2 [Lentisphaeria bacterium]